MRVSVDGTSSLGHVVQSLGVPLTEVGRVLVNGEPCPDTVPAVEVGAAKVLRRRRALRL